jgi:hypothetical protein
VSLAASIRRALSAASASVRACRAASYLGFLAKTAEYAQQHIFGDMES